MAVIAATRLMNDGFIQIQNIEEPQREMRAEVDYTFSNDELVENCLAVGQHRMFCTLHLLYFKLSNSA